MGRWSGHDTQDKGRRAQKLFPISEGQECETPTCTDLATLHHHRDEVPENNVRSNIDFLCRSCHIKIHHSGERLALVALICILHHYGRSQWPK